MAPTPPKFGVGPPVSVIQADRPRPPGDPPLDDVARKEDPAGVGLGQARLAQPMAIVGPADFEAVLGEDPLRLVDDPPDALGVQDVQARPNRGSLGSGHQGDERQRSRPEASSARQSSVTASRQCGMWVSKPSARTLGSIAICASGSPWTRKTRRGKPAAPGCLPRAKLASQASSSDSSAWAEKPLIDRIRHFTSRAWPSSFTTFTPAWRCAPSVPSPW